MGFERHIPGGAIRWAERDRHDYLSGLFARAMAPTAVQSWRPQMTAVVDAHLDRMAATSNGTTDGFAPLGPVRELVRAAWSEMLFGIASAGPDYAEVCSITDELDVYRPDPRSDEEIDRRLDRLSEMIRTRAEGDDPSTRSGVPTEIERHRPGALEDPGTVRNLIYAMLTARDDVGGLLMWILKHLADHPEWAEAVRTSTPEGVVDRVVSETLRLQQSEFLFRRARRQLPVGNAVIPKGWIARVCIHEIHRDPDKFDDPERFDPDRFIDGGCGRDVYAPFGIDHHSCVGEAFARGFAAVFAERVTRRFDLEIVEDGPVELSAHRHWAPSGRFRLRLHAVVEIE
jgi:cytochrome P450